MNAERITGKSASSLLITSYSFLQFCSGRIHHIELDRFSIHRIIRVDSRFVVGVDVMVRPDRVRERESTA